jgi:hypothetical protein
MRNVCAQGFKFTTSLEIYVIIVSIIKVKHNTHVMLKSKGKTAENNVGKDKMMDVSRTLMCVMLLKTDETSE